MQGRARPPPRDPRMVLATPRPSQSLPPGLPARAPDRALAPPHRRIRRDRRVHGFSRPRNAEQGVEAVSDPCQRDGARRVTAARSRTWCWPHRHAPAFQHEHRTKPCAPPHRRIRRDRRVHGFSGSRNDEHGVEAVSDPSQRDEAGRVAERDGVRHDVSNSERAEHRLRPGWRVPRGDDAQYRMARTGWRRRVFGGADVAAQYRADRERDACRQLYVEQPYKGGTADDYGE